MLKKIKNEICDFILKYNFIISILISIFTIVACSEEIFKLFKNEKTEVLSMLISISGTLFGFILTFLTIFIVFKTEEKYERTPNNEHDPLILLINNKAFDSVYELFIESSYAIGLLLMMCIIYYFISFNVMLVELMLVNFIIVLIVVCCIKMILSLCTFNTLIRLLVSCNKK